MNIVKKFLLKKNGQAVILLLTGIAIFSMAIIIGVENHKNELLQVKSQKLTGTRSTIVALVETYLKSNEIIKLSAKSTIYSLLPVGQKNGNEAFDFCFNGSTATCTGAPTCCQTVVNQPFALVDPADTSKLIAGTDAASSPLASTSLAPIYYDINGKRCGVLGGNCLLELVTAFSATCPGGISPCAKAESISISFKLRQASTVLLAGIAPLAPVTSSVSVSLATPLYQDRELIQLTHFTRERLKAKKPGLYTLADLNAECENEFGPNYKVTTKEECIANALDNEAYAFNCRDVYVVNPQSDGTIQIGYTDQNLQDGDWAGVACKYKKQIFTKRTSAIYDIATITVLDLDIKCKEEFGNNYSSVASYQCRENSNDINGCKEVFTVGVKKNTGSPVKYISCRGDNSSCGSSGKIWPILCQYNPL